MNEHVGFWESHTCNRCKGWTALVQHTHLNKEVSQIEGVMFRMFGRSTVIGGRNSLLNSVSVRATIGSTFVPVVWKHLSFHSQTVILLMLCQDTGHTWLQSLWESFQLKWSCWIKSSNHLVMVRENWFPLNLHNAIRCWKLAFVYSTRGAHQPMNQSGEKTKKTQNKNINYSPWLWKDYQRYFLKKENDPHWFWWNGQAGINSRGKPAIEKPSLLLLGSISRAFLNNKLCLVYLWNWIYLRCFTSWKTATKWTMCTSLQPGSVEIKVSVPRWCEFFLSFFFFNYLKRNCAFQPPDADWVEKSIRHVCQSAPQHLCIFAAMQLVPHF